MCLQRGAVVEADWVRRALGSTFFDTPDKYPNESLPPNPCYEELANCEKLVVRSKKEVSAWVEVRVYEEVRAPCETLHLSPEGI